MIGRRGSYNIRNIGGGGGGEGMKGERLREKRRGIIISRDEEDAKGRRSPSMEKSRRSFSLVFFAICCVAAG